MERMQPVPRDSKDNGVAAMLVYHNKGAKHGGDEVTCICPTVIYVMRSNLEAKVSENKSLELYNASMVISPPVGPDVESANS